MRKLLLLLLTDTLLVICLSWTLSYEYLQNTNVRYSLMRYYVPRDQPVSNQENLFFSAPSILKEHAKKKFITVSLTGDLIEDEKRLEFIQWKARELKYTNDTTHILKIHLPKVLTYGKFIRLLNMMNEDLHKRYFEYNYDFYIFGEPPARPIESID